MKTSMDDLMKLIVRQQLTIAQLEDKVEMLQELSQTDEIDPLTDEEVARLRESND